MKRELKYFLLGAFSVVGGFLIYVWTRDPSKSTQAASENRAANAPAPTASSSAPGTYVAHRKEQLQKQKVSPSCSAVRSAAADSSLPDSNAAAATAPGHTAQSTNAEENDQ